MQRKWFWTASLMGVLILGGVLAGPLMSQVETPKYKTLQSHGEIEIRRYAPMVVANVTVEGSRETAIGDGFRLLADYIFGNNTLKQKPQSIKIPMTAPVQQTASDGVWKVSFVMPAEYSLQSLPRPNNQKIELQQVPTRKMVVIQFSGTHSTKNLESHAEKLRDFIQKQELEAKGEPEYAFYNPPWTLPLFRRNEIMFEIR